MPPLLAAAEMLASPVANRTIPQASALPILGLVAAGPAATGPFMVKATGASTGPWPRAQPAINAAQDNASTKLFNMASPSLAARFWRLVGLARLRTRSRGCPARARRRRGRRRARLGARLVPAV